MRSDAPGESPDQPDELARLPHGRHGLPPEFVERNQRARLLTALVQVVAERGYNDTTITRIIEGAGVTSRTFYRYFESVEECYLAALDAAGDLLAERLAEAWASEDDWPLRVRAAIATVLEFFSGSPELARLCLVETFVAGPNISRRYQEAIERLTPYMREGRTQREDPPPMPDTAERGLLGSIGSQIGRKVSAGQAADLPDQLPDLTQFALTPYLGAEKARRVGLGES